MLKTLARWGPLLYLFPHRYVRPDLDWSEFHIAEFNKRFEWRIDDWRGWKDFVQPVEETYESGRGDCEDYAVVVASALLARTEWPVHLSFLYGLNRGHVVVHTDDIVYSSGTRSFQTIEEYVTDSPYSVTFTRTVRK